MLLLGFSRPVASLFTSLHSSSVCRFSLVIQSFLKILILERHLNHIPRRSVNLSNGLCYQCRWVSFFTLKVETKDWELHRAVQAVDRALLIDTLPPSRQVSGNAWAASMSGVGSVVGFFMFALPRRIHCFLVWLVWTVATLISLASFHFWAKLNSKYCPSSFHFYCLLDTWSWRCWSKNPFCVENHKENRSIKKSGTSGVPWELFPMSFVKLYASFLLPWILCSNAYLSSASYSFCTSFLSY